MEFEPMLTTEMSPEEDRTRDAVDSEPKHYQLSYSGPAWTFKPAACVAELDSVLPLNRLVGLSGKLSATSTADLGSIPAFVVDLFRGQAIPVT